MKHLYVTPVIGLPQVTGWSQVTENPHTAPNRLICAFALYGEQAGNIGRDISEDISQFIPHSLEEAYSFLENLEEKYRDADISIYFAAGIFLGTQAAYAVNGGSVLLKRNGKVGAIVHSEGGLKLVTGSYTADDVIVLATYQATSFFNEIEQKFKTGFDLDTIITSIVPGLHSQPDSSLSALAFIVPSTREYLPPEEEEPLLEVSLETDSEETGVVIEEDITDEIEDDDLVAQPQIGLDEVAAPSQEAVAELGLNEPLPQEPKPSQAVSKIWKLLAMLAAAFGKLFSLLLKALASFASTLIAKAKNFRFSSLRPEKLKETASILTSRKQYLGQGQSKKLMRILILVILLAVLIAGGWYFYAARISSAREEAASLLLPHTVSLETAGKLAAQNPVGARELVSIEIRELEALKNKHETEGDKIAVEEIEKVLNEAKSLHESISGKEELSALMIFYDLRLVKSDFVVGAADAGGNIAALVDAGNQQMVILNLETKQPTLVDLSGIGVVSDVRVRSNEVIILAEGIYSVSFEGGEPEEIIPAGDSNRDGVLLGAYDRYIYVLNPGKRNVYRYASDDDGEFSDPIGWMQAARGLVYENVTSWTIDGEIWMGTAEGEVRRFASGRSEDFEIRGLTESLNSSLRLATLTESEQLYVLEPENSRFVVLSKNGDFLREVKSSSLASANSLILSEPMGKAFAVSGSILFEISL